MEVVEEPPLVSDVADSGKLNNASDEVDNCVAPSTEADVCLESNGDAEPKQYMADTLQPSSTELYVKENEANAPVSEPNEDKTAEESVEITTAIVEEEIVETRIVEEDQKESVVVNTTMETTETEVEVKVENVVVRNESIIEETVVEVDGIIDPTEENVTFETEVLVESNDMDIEEHLDKTTNDDTNNAILNDLSHNIDLSEVLRSSDVTNNVENNNCEQEVFNKEELLDILEGNDSEQVESRKIISENFPEDSKKLEEQLALQQLSRLQSKKTRNRKTIEKKTPKKRLSRNEDGAKKEAPKKDSSKQENDKVAEDKSKEEISNDDQQKIQNVEVSKEESIVNELVKDWEDDDHVENDDTRKLRKSTEKSTKSQEANISKPESEQSHNDVSMDEGSTSKTGDESQPQRRLGRVIKKKVIFDPDNPDTFTKSKAIKKEASEKDHSPSKKSKSDQSSLRSKSKSPVNKLQWKKPNPKNSKQSYKRLTEIDKLLMDEGAVNMICQLTTEAPKGKMNMKSKAEFIKKIQSNTPDSKEKKFRERKKEIKTEDGEPKKIAGGKHRLSLSSSVKSPSVSEDFEAHSADDSIIYRRHSSSSYSSSCMSPRRLSDVENNTKEPAPAPQTVAPEAPAQNESILSNNTSAASEVFLTDNTSTPTKEIMNKRDCLSIKEKLNSKLSQVLNKRKRESTKADKPSKLRKGSTPLTVTVSNDNKFVYVNYKDNVAELCIGKSGSLYTPQMLQEINNLLSHIDAMDNINVTLILSEGEILCSGIDLRSILLEEKKVDQAKEIAEALKCLQTTLAQHSKLTCMGVLGKCEGFSLALAALCDVVIAGEGASFSMLEPNKVLLQPGAAALRESALPRNLLNDIIIFGRKLSASEALNSGLVSRVIWPERFVEQMRAIAKDVATQPAENLMMKKKLLSLNRNSESSFLSSIEKEKDLLVNYWTSSEGLQTLISIFTNSG